MPVPQTNPLIRGPDADAHVLHTLMSIKAPEIDEALLVLPFDFACRLIPYLNRHVANGTQVESCVHALLFLLSTHAKQLISQQSLLSTIRDSRQLVRFELTKMKTTIGFNVAAMKFIQRNAEEKKGEFYFGEKNNKTTTTTNSTQKNNDEQPNKKRKV